MTSTWRVRAKVATRDFDVDLTLPAGTCTAVVGANGAGKSTLLSLLAGQLRPDRGAGSLIELNGRRLVDDDRVVPPHRRGVMLLQQRSMLFPHLSVLENVVFGVRSSTRSSSAAARDAARSKLSEVAALEFADRRPDQLSGGQQQRVALARALATNPELVALDEPLSALDVAAAADLRLVLAAQLTGRTSVLVTHDLLDVVTIASHVVVLDRGRVVAEGPTSDVFSRPRHRFVADLIGVSVLSGEATADGLRLDDGTLIAATAEHDVRGSAHALVPMSAVSLAPGSIGFPAVVRRVEPRGATVRVVTDLAGQDVATELSTLDPATARTEPGSLVHLTFDGDQISVYR